MLSSAALGGSGMVDAAAVSRAKKLPISPIALINGAGNTTVVFLSTPNSTKVCRLRRLHVQRLVG